MKPIIEREVFEKVKGLLNGDTRTAPKDKQLYLFSGFLRCADCGRAMSRISSKELYELLPMRHIQKPFQESLYHALDKKHTT